MSVLPSDIVVYGSANMLEADGAINGGPVDFSRRVAFYDIAPAGNLDVISSSASDTATKITFYGRDATGVVQNQTLTLNGQTWVTGSQSAGTAAVRRFVGSDRKRSRRQSGWHGCGWRRGAGSAQLCIAGRLSHH